MTSPLAPTRVTRSLAEARAGYDRIAGVYDWLAGASERPFRRRALDLLALQSGESVLEIGCGTGEALVELAGITAEATGVDLSPRMLEQARRRLAAAGRSARLIEGDAHELPIESASQDAVFMSFVLDLVDTPDLPGFLAEVRRVLRPAGRLALVTMSADGGNALAAGIYRWAHRVFPVAVDCRPLHLGAVLEAGGFRADRLEQGTMWGLGVAWAVAR